MSWAGSEKVIDTRVIIRGVSVAMPAAMRTKVSAGGFAGEMVRQCG